MKTELPKNVVTQFTAFKLKYNQFSYGDYSDNTNPIIGKLWWKKPNHIMWIYATNNDEDYEGSQTQIGVDKQGTLFWSYFSHCSCNSYSDADSDSPPPLNPFEESDIQSQKTYELENVDKEVLHIIKSKLKEISKWGLKD